jgi:hypothetical protein
MSKGCQLAKVLNVKLNFKTKFLFWFPEGEEHAADNGACVQGGVSGNAEPRAER